MTVDIEGLLGAEGKMLLEHHCTTIPKESIHLPGPGDVDRIYALSERYSYGAKGTGRNGGIDLAQVIELDLGRTF